MDRRKNGGDFGDPTESNIPESRTSAEIAFYQLMDQALTTLADGVDESVLSFPLDVVIQKGSEDKPVVIVRPTVNYPGRPSGLHSLLAFANDTDKQTYLKDHIDEDALSITFKELLLLSGSFDDPVAIDIYHKNRRTLMPPIAVEKIGEHFGLYPKPSLIANDKREIRYLPDEKVPKRIVRRIKEVLATQDWIIDHNIARGEVNDVTFNVLRVVPRNTYSLDEVRAHKAKLFEILAPKIRGNFVLDVEFSGLAKEEDRLGPNTPQAHGNAVNNHPSTQTKSKSTDPKHQPPSVPDGKPDIEPEGFTGPER